MPCNLNATICARRYLKTHSFLHPWQWVSYTLALAAVLSKETGVMAIPINLVLGGLTPSSSSSPSSCHPHPSRDKKNRLAAASTKLKWKRLALDFAVVSTR